MEPDEERPAPKRHGLATRTFHMVVALSVIWQLSVSLVMEGPRQGQAGDLFFTVHSYVGLATFALISLFWMNLMVRRVGTDPRALFPWLSSERRSALLSDARAHVGAARRLRLPRYTSDSALASAVHGLGLLLMTGMAASGAAWWFLQPSIVAGSLENAHKLLANLAWVYVIAHAGLGILHHLRGEASLSEMWSLSGRD